MGIGRVKTEYRVTVYVTRAEFAVLNRMASAQAITPGRLLWQIDEQQLREWVATGPVNSLDDERRDKELKVPVSRADYVRLECLARTTSESVNRLAYRYSAGQVCAKSRDAA